MMEQIKILRDKSGAGIADCKKALEETSGDIEKAMEFLRKQGIAKAAKRGERDASQGVVKLGVSQDQKEGYILEVNSETDFVSRNEKFQNLAESFLTVAKEKKPQNLDELFNLTLEDGHTVKENLESLSGVIGEKLVLKRYDYLKTNGICAAYSHMNGSIGVLVSIDRDDQALAQEVAMQVAAANPKYIQPEEVNTSEIEKEKEIYREQLKKEGKPAEMIEKILLGKINKYFEDVCLVKQEYIKDDSKKIENILNGAKVEKFVRYSL
jgi:elongation factor Ts